ncbi:hypothetical protein [Terrisporobacter mayombei]|uniref:DUF4355 domain-containing protein n=1 Tax=Terrisporobacter mayombei TaxID=1541 RepID=A0ABY9Q6M6_9FIRM|nr:hypothetical protein [Terrisporobacter mayombei]MCC3870394.1 hypothetical protein [Terrisporobacter mayombei]WMT83646.1 hypothetical protein TEMA_41670 [Terrisporobacter mayombei]
MDKDKDTNLEQESPVEQVSNNNNDDDFEKRLQEALKHHLDALNKKVDIIGLDNKRLSEEKRSLEVTDELNKRNLDSSLFSVVYDSDPEITTAKINLIEQIFQKELTSRMKKEEYERVTANSYIPPGTNSSGGAGLESFDNIVRRG